MVNAFYNQGTHGPSETLNIGELLLESGGTLRQCKIAFATFGKLTDAKDNVILVPTWFGGSNTIMEQGYIGPGLFKSEGWRDAGDSSLDDFLLNFPDASFLPTDPNNLLCMARKWRRADVGRHAGGDLAAALGRIEARTMVLPIGSDMFFTAADCAAEQAMIRGSELRVSETRWGHAGLFGMDRQYRHQVDAALGHLLAQPA